MRKLVLITGASRGLGKSMALASARKGMDVIITYHSQKEAALNVVEKIKQLDVNAVALPLNVGDSGSFSGFSDTLKAVLKSEFKREDIDCLVNNAGMGLTATIADTAEEQFDALMNVHLKGVFFLTQSMLPIVRNGGTILNVSSGLTRFSMPGYAAYSMMKGGIEVMTRYLAKELGERKIQANTIAPGAIETDFRGGAVRDTPEVNQYIASVTALGRAGLPDDIGGAVALMLSDEASWINGQRIEISGGMFV